MNFCSLVQLAFQSVPLPAFLAPNLCLREASDALSNLLVASHVLERKKGHSDTRVPMYTAPELTSTTGGTTPKGEAVANTRMIKFLEFSATRKEKFLVLLQDELAFPFRGGTGR